MLVCVDALDCCLVYNGWWWYVVFNYVLVVIVVVQCVRCSARGCSVVCSVVVVVPVQVITAGRLRRFGGGGL